MDKIVLIQMIIFTVYILYVVKKHGVLPSISDSWYTLKEESLFVLFCFLIGFLNFFHGTYFVISGWCLFWVAATAHFRKNKFVKVTHYIAAVSSIVFALIGLAIDYNTLLPLVPISLSFLINKNRIWWVEVVSFYSIMLSL